MRTIKPVCCSVLTRCLEHRRQYFLNISVLTHVPLMGSAYLGAEQKLWPLLARHAPGFVEECISRLESEFLLYGQAYPDPTAKNQAYVDVGIRVGDLAKKARVFGIRQMWQGKIQRQLPVEVTPLVPEHAYGGPDYALNPQGTGHDSSIRDGVLSLPRIELLDYPWQRETERNYPALFGQLEITHPLRQEMAGTYDEHWLKQQYPGMPEDADWRIFNTAMPDQRQRKAFTGNERFTLVNLSPEQSRVHNRLPGIRARVWVRFHAQDVLHDLQTVLRSLLFLPQANTVVLIWQTQCQVSRDDATDVALLVAGFEHLERAKSQHHYQRAIARYLDKKEGQFASLDESPWLPEGMPHAGLLDGVPELNRKPDPDSLSERLKRDGERRMQAARKDVEALGLDADEHGPPAHFGQPEPYPPPHEMGHFLHKKRKEAEQAFREAKRKQEKAIEASAQDCKAMGVDFSQVREEMAGRAPGSSLVGPPPSRWAQNVHILRDANEQAKAATGQPIDEIEQMLADEDLQATWRKGDRDALKLYRLNAHRQTPAPRLDAETAQRKREWVHQRLQSGKSLEGVDLTGADLSGMDLSGVNARNALMESVNLQNACLRNADFSHAVLAHADLRKADLRQCNFQRANLGKAALSGANAAQAIFSKAILEQAQLAHVHFQGAVFAHTKWYRLNFKQSDLSHCALEKSTWLHCDFQEANLCETRLEGANFIKCQYRGSIWRGCKGEKVTFIDVEAQGLDFSSCELPASNWSGTIVLEQASFRGGVLDRAYFARESILHAVDFSQSQAISALFAACRLEYCRFQAAVLKQAGFKDAVLIGSDFTNADLMQASLQNADLSACRLLGTHLFEADLARIHTDGRTRAEGVEYERARVYPRLKNARNTP